MSLLEKLLQQPDDSQDLARIRQSVQRHLQMLMESRRALWQLPPSATELPASLARYGMNNLHQTRTPYHAQKLCQQIEQLISNFEPRLSDVSVVFEQVEEQSNAVRFRIEAVLVAAGTEEEVWFDSTVNLTNATVDLKEHGLV